MTEGAQIRVARLEQFLQRAGTGHSGEDVKMLVGECFRLRAVLTNAAADLDAGADRDTVAARLREAARAHGE